MTGAVDAVTLLCETLMKRAVTYRCPAKVNLALSVGSPGENGYHPICSWVAAVSLWDDLTVAPLQSGEEAEFDIDWAADAPLHDAIDWPVHDDLVFKAHRLMSQYAERPLPVAITVRKRIPAGAGLAGGSSDAAMTLRALNDLFELGMEEDELREIGAHLGADLPFFLTGGVGSAAIVRGVGEIVEPAPMTEPIHLALILPHLRCSTKRVYQRFDAIAPHAEVGEQMVRAMAATGPTAEVPLFNDLAEAACAVEPRLAELRRRCERIAGRAVHVTGSGAALFLTAMTAADAERMATAITAAVDVTALAVQTLTDQGNVY